MRLNELCEGLCPKIRLLSVEAGLKRVQPHQSDIESFRTLLNIAYLVPYVGEWYTSLS
jgi:hypothetical protein